MLNLDSINEGEDDESSDEFAFNFNHDDKKEK